MKERGRLKGIANQLDNECGDPQQAWSIINQGRPGGVVVYQYTRKKFTKIPKIHPNIPKIMPRYTLYLKFKKSDIPNTRI